MTTIPAQGLDDESRQEQVAPGARFNMEVDLREAVSRPDMTANGRQIT